VSGGKDFTMSATRRAGTRATPSSEASTGTCTSVVTSRSVVVSVSPSFPTDRRTPVRAGIPGLVETPRWAVCRASARTSRSHRSFTAHLLRSRRTEKVL
jgi:hypothetical protein